MRRRRGALQRLRPDSVRLAHAPRRAGELHAPRPREHRARVRREPRPEQDLEVEAHTLDRREDQLGVGAGVVQADVAPALDEDLEVLLDLLGRGVDPGVGALARAVAGVADALVLEARQLLLSFLSSMLDLAQGRFNPIT